jgi:hypothetical protein
MIRRLAGGRQKTLEKPFFSALKFAFGLICRYDRGMVAMADPFTDYMTVRDVMAAIKARSHSTVLRLVYDEEKTQTAPGDRPLAGTKIAGHVWMIRRSAVAAFLADDAQRKRGVGFPRGRTRAEPAPKAPSKPAAAAGRKAKKAAKKRRSR